VPFSVKAPYEYRDSTRKSGFASLYAIEDGKPSGELPLLLQESASLLAGDPARYLHTQQLRGPDRNLWLIAQPNRPAYYIPDKEWETAMRARYCIPPIPITSPSERLRCVCGASIPAMEFVVHALDCRHVKGKTKASRHALVKKAFKAILSEYGFDPDPHEPRFQYGEGADILFQLGDTTVTVDVTVVNTLAPSYRRAELENEGSSLVEAENRKEANYGSAARNRNFTFFPLAISTFGELGPKSTAFLRKVSANTADVTHKSGFFRHARTALSVAVARGNAQIIAAAVAGWYDSGVR
jgi:hypothetical protein